VAAHRLVLAIGPVPLLIFVALIARDDDDGANAGSVPDSLEKVSCSEDVDCIGLHRALIGETYERLRCHVDNNLRLEIAQGGLERSQVTNVRANRLKLTVKIEEAIETGISGRIERVAADIGSHRKQPESHPTALEAGVSGKENLSRMPEVYVHR
jgi:hypothetical protein